MTIPAKAPHVLAAVAIMRFVRLVFPAAWFPLTLAVASAADRPPPVDTATAWLRWEQTLTSAKDHANPYRDVDLRVTFAGPQGRSFASYGFWDGGKSFKVRAAFPAAGDWTWTSTCSDPADAGLHAHSGCISVAPYSGENSLYRHGFLQVGANRRHLAHADGTPFLWIGDTPWSAFVAATPDAWENYLDNRQRNKFTVVQVHCGSGFTKLATDRDGHAPMLGNGTALQWNPAYWQGVERKVQAANERGLLVFICAVRQPGAGFPAKGFPVNDASEVARFAQNLAARLMGSFVVYSPIADDEWSPLADAAGEALHRATLLHLITAHPRFLLEPAVTFHGKAYIDVAGVQTGEGWTHDPYKKEPKAPFSTLLAAQNAFEWPLTLYQRDPAKPVINHEGPYDHPVEADGRVPLPPRKAGYWSFLSGACGFTYGCFGIWNWGQPVGWYPTYDFPTALTLPSVAHIKYLAEFFGGIRWWTLVPHPELVSDHTADPMHRMGFARSTSGDLAVAYLPDNDTITLDLSGFGAPLRARWFNPLTGGHEDVATVVPARVRQSLTRPAGWADAVLLLERAP